MLLLLNSVTLLALKMFLTAKLKINRNLLIKIKSKKILKNKVKEQNAKYMINKNLEHFVELFYR
jgi:hypothetical protein